MNFLIKQEVGNKKEYRFYSDAPSIIHDTKCQRHERYNVDQSYKTTIQSRRDDRFQKPQDRSFLRNYKEIIAFGKYTLIQYLLLS